MRKALIQGSIIAATGMALLVFSGIFLPAQQLKYLGSFFILTALLLITLGLYPFQQLKKLEITPHEIQVLDEDQFLFLWKRKPVFAVSFESIKNLSYYEVGNQYGISLSLKRDCRGDFEGVSLIDSNFDLTKYQDSCQKKYGCNLFLPYFSKRSFETFMSYVQDSN